MSDPQTVDDFLGWEDLERRRAASRKLAPKAPGSWKAALALQIEIEWFIKKYGVAHCALLTLLFAQPSQRPRVTPAEAQEIFKKAARSLFPNMFKAYVAVLDFHRSGNVHFHLVVATHMNIARGWRADLDEQHRAIQKRVKEEKRRMTPQELKISRSLCRQMMSDTCLKALLKPLKAGLKSAGFPASYPCEIKPIRNPPGIARYLAGRYRESLARRDLRPAHSRCQRFSTSYTRCVDKDLRFSPVGPGARFFRAKKAAVGAALGIHDIGEMITRFGESWEYDFGDILQPVNRYEDRGFFDHQLVRLTEVANQYRPIFTAVDASLRAELGAALPPGPQTALTATNLAVPPPPIALMLPPQPGVNPA